MNRCSSRCSSTHQSSQHGQGGFWEPVGRAKLRGDSCAMPCSASHSTLAKEQQPHPDSCWCLASPSMGWSPRPVHCLLRQGHTLCHLVSVQLGLCSGPGAGWVPQGPEAAWEVRLGGTHTPSSAMPHTEAIPRAQAHVSKSVPDELALLL
jgi:hypothetical protein